MENRKCIYFVEGECEEKLINALKIDTSNQRSQLLGIVRPRSPALARKSENPCLSRFFGFFVM